MTALLAKYAERIDAASLRERVMIFLAATLVLVFVVNAQLLEPLRAKQKRLAAETAQGEQELRTVQAELRRLVQASEGDPDAANRRAQAQLRERIAALNARIAQEQKRFTTPERMRGVLAEILERNKGLRLVSLRNLEAAPLQAAPAPGQAAAQGLYRHGIELAIEGSYLDLHAYLRALEQSPTQLYWGKAELVVGEHPLATLKLTVYTVSFDRAWLIV